MKKMYMVGSKKFNNENSIMILPAWRLINKMKTFNDCQKRSLTNWKKEW